MSESNDDARIKHRINVIDENNDALEFEEYFNDVSQKQIIIIENDDEIINSLNLMIDDSETNQFNVFLSILSFSQNFSVTLLKNFTPKHFEILYNSLYDIEIKPFALAILSNFSKKNAYIPPSNIFSLLINAMNIEFDETNIENCLLIFSNLIDRNKEIYMNALKSNVLQFLNNLFHISIKTQKLVLKIIAKMLKFDNHEIDQTLIDFILTASNFNTERDSILREIINGLNNSMIHSEYCINLLCKQDNNNIISIVEKLLLSDKQQSVLSALQFVNSLVNLTNNIYPNLIEGILLLMTKDEENFIYKDCISLLVLILKCPRNQINTLFIFLSQIKISTILYSKPFKIKALFLKFIEATSNICINEFLLLHPDDLSRFLIEMFETDVPEIQYITTNIISLLLNSLSYSQEWCLQFSSFIENSTIIDSYVNCEAY